VRCQTALPVLVGLLAGCPKSPAKPSGDDATEANIWATTDEEPTRRVPDGWLHVDLPMGVSDVRPSSSMATEDGSVWIAGSAVKIAQHQWLLRAPGLEEPVQHIYDPGRIIHISSNETGGVAAVGVLGGIPADKAWFGNIDAFGETSSRQTYLSSDSGQLRGIHMRESNLVLAGTVATGVGSSGWLIAADRDGSDIWKRTYGDTGDYALNWVHQGENGIVAIGTRRTSTGTDAAWFLHTDATGTISAERNWQPKTWTQLTTGIAHDSGDIFAAGLVSPNQFGADDGEASLWIGRLNNAGLSAWDRIERDDLSELSMAVPWRDGIALVARTGGIGTLDRRTWLVRSSGSGEVTWTELNVPEEVNYAAVHSISSDTLKLVAVISDEMGVSWTTYPLELNDERAL
jgi:hypothetical protein